METTEQHPTASVHDANPAPSELASDHSQYEFTPKENMVIGSLAWKMHFVGLFALAIGILVIIIGIVMYHYFPILSGTIYAVIGIWTERAAVSFRRVVDTKGKDITHLMDALDDLRKLYTLQFWLCIIGLVGAILSLYAVSQRLHP